MDGRLPVALDRSRTRSRVPRQDMSWRQLTHALDQGARAGDVPEYEELVDGYRIQVIEPGDTRQQRGQLRGEAQLAATLGVEERLLPEPVACSEQTAPARVPDREGEHALERVDQLVAVLLVEVDENLGVTTR